MNMVDKEAAPTSPMEVVGMGPRDEDGGSSSSLRTAETLLRLLPIAPCVVALVVMLHDSQTNDFGSLSYSHLGAFRYVCIHTHKHVCALHFIYHQILILFL